MNEKTTQENSQKNSEKKGMRKVPLKDLGSRLCLGNPRAEYKKDVVIRPWRMKEEKELGKLREETKGESMSVYVSMVLGSLCTNIGENDFSNMKDPEKRLRISQMFMGDVFTAYCLVRLKAMGKNIELKPTCVVCDHTFPFTADLESVEVTIADSLEDCLWTYELTEPIVVRNKERKKLTIGPLRWFTMENINNNSINLGMAKAATIVGSIYKFDDEEIVVDNSEIDEMVKVDIENLITGINEKALGPNMSVEGNCPRGICKREFIYPIDWSFDSFFGISSQ
jgi:hypothetical protein